MRKTLNKTLNKNLNANLSSKVSNSKKNILIPKIIQTKNLSFIKLSKLNINDYKFNIIEMRAICHIAATLIKYPKFKKETILKKNKLNIKLICSYRKNFNIEGNQLIISEFNKKHCFLIDFYKKEITKDTIEFQLNISKYYVQVQNLSIEPQVFYYDVDTFSKQKVNCVIVNNENKVLSTFEQDFASFMKAVTIVYKDLSKEKVIKKITTKIK